MEQHRYRAIPGDLCNEGLPVLRQKLCDGRERFHEDASHLLSLEITGSQNECGDSGIHQCRSFKIPVPDAMVFGQYDPSMFSDI
jgi:hypothetical protein